FTVTAPPVATSGRLQAVATVGGARYTNERIDINYAHIPEQILQPPARARLVAIDVATRGKTVGYLPGAGDDTAENLRQLGYEVVLLSGADLTPERLASVGAVVIGVRAFNTRTDLVPNLPALFDYVR